jgi:hypothetical protein
VGPKRIFGSLGEYSAINWFFLLGFLAPVPVYILHRCYPKVKLFRLINMPILIGATGNMPPATSVNYTSWFIMAFIFNFVIFRYRKNWWVRYNYVLSGALDAGIAFMGVLLYIALGLNNIQISWWGTNYDGCALATCPTQPGVNITGCPVFWWAKKPGVDHNFSHSTLLSRDHWMDGWMPLCFDGQKTVSSQFFTLNIIV